MLFLIVPLAYLNLFGTANREVRSAGRWKDKERKKLSGADLCHNLPGWTEPEVDRERRTIAGEGNGNPRGPQSEPLNQGEHYGNFPANMIGPHMH